MLVWFVFVELGWVMAAAAAWLRPKEANQTTNQTFNQTKQKRESAEGASQSTKKKKTLIFFCFLMALPAPSSGAPSGSAVSSLHLIFVVLARHSAINNKERDEWEGLPCFSSANQAFLNWRKRALRGKRRAEIKSTPIIH